MYKLTLSTIFALASFSLFAQESPSVVMVMSSYGELDNNNELVKPGFEFDELSKAYRVFKANGLNITLASPHGGKPVADQYDANKPYNQQFLSDTQAVQSLETTYKVSALENKQFDAVFVVGGKGPMFDLYKHAPLQRLIANTYEQQGVVSAVCHGPAAFVDVKLSNGRYLVAGKQVNGFTNLEEMAFGKKWRPKFDFLLEDKLKERGGKFESAGLMLGHVAVDGNLITGQNPFSTADTAMAVVRALGIEPVELEPNKDDKTMAFVAQVMEGSLSAVKAYKQNPAQYDGMLVAMSGVYQLKTAPNEKTVNGAVALLELIKEQINHPMVDLSLANGYVQQGKHKEAKQIAQAVRKAHPDNSQAKALLDSLAEI